MSQDTELIERFVEAAVSSEQALQQNNIFRLHAIYRAIRDDAYDLLRRPEEALRLKSKWGENCTKFIDLILKTDFKLGEKIADLATFDHKTGLYNYLAFGFLFDANILGYKEKRVSDVAEALLDIDDFKLVNKRYGYQIADNALSEVGAIVRSNLRQSPEARDIATLLRYEQAGRFGGEEIVIVFPNTPISEAKKRADKIRQEIKESEVIGDLLGRPLTASFGVQTASACEVVSKMMLAEPNLVDSMLSQCNAALFFVKSTGKDRVATFEESLRDLHKLRRKDVRNVAETLGVDMQNLKKFRKEYLERVSA